MNILRISCSPRGREAESHKLSDLIVHRLVEQGGPATLLAERMLCADPVPHIGADYENIVRMSEAERQGNASAIRSEELIGEVERADAIVIATPMHNLAAPSVLKAWIDHVVRAGRTFDVTTEGKKGRLWDRPVFVAISSGGHFSGEQARQPDFLVPYLSAVLGMIGLANITFFSIQGTGMGGAVLAHARQNAARAVSEHFAL